MNYWLVKSEPNNYSIDDLKRDKTTLWDGVRNYQARNILRDQWQVGDQVLFYHSVVKPIGVVGVAKVTEIDLPDPLQFKRQSKYYDPKANKEAPTWWSPKVKFVKRFKNIVALEELKKIKALTGMKLLEKGSRLSVQPVSKKTL